MQTPNSKWDVERAAAWLRKHAWGEGGEAVAPALDGPLVAEAQAEVAAAADPGGALAEEEEIDIAGWPALVAPFYD